MSIFHHVLGYGLRFAPESDAGGAAGGAGGGGSPGSAAAPALTGSGLPVPAPAAAGSAPPAKPAPAELDFGGRKLPADVPGARELYGDWQNLQRELQRVKAEYQRAQEALAALASTGPAGAVPAPVPPASEPDWDALAEELETKLFQGGPEAVQVLREIVRREIAPAIEPIAAYQQFHQDAATLAAKYADFDALQPEMDRVLEEQPHLADLPNALETVYWVAKGRVGGTGSGGAASPDWTQALADPQVVAQLAQSEPIRNAVLQAYLNERTRANATLPPAPAGAGAAPVLPPHAPKTVREGTAAFLAAHGQRRG